MRLLIIVISFVCAVIFLGDFVISGSHPFYDLGAAIGFLVVSAVFIFLSVRGK